MKKNTLIGVLILIIVTLMTYAKVKSNEVEKATEMVIRYNQAAEAERQRAEEQMQIAMHNAVQARIAQADAEKALADCNSK